MDLATIGISATALMIMFTLSYGAYQVLSISDD